MNALQRYFKLDDQQWQDLKLFDYPVVIDGDFPQIWADRRWHHETKAEIYCLIWATKQLGFQLPILVFERIAFWIQLIELCKDFRAGKLEVIFLWTSQTVGPEYLALAKTLELILPDWNWYLRYTNFDGVIANSLRKLQTQVRKFTRYDDFFLLHFFQRKDRYRIYTPYSEQWYDLLLKE